MASPSIHAMKDGDVYATEFASTTAGLQAAIDYLAGGKGVVHIGAGTLETTATIWLHSYCTLRGSGIGATIIKRATGSMANGDATQSGSVINVSAYGSNGTIPTIANPQYGISVYDLTVDGNYSNFGSVTQANLVPEGLRMEFVDGLIVQNVKAQNVLGNGFYNRYCRNAIFKNIQTDTVGQWSEVESRNAFDFQGDAGGSGEWGYNLVVDGAQFTTTGDEAFMIAGVNNVAISNVNVDGCDFVFEVSNSGPVATGQTYRNWSISNITAKNVLDYMVTFNTTGNDFYENVVFSNLALYGHATLHDGGAIAFPSGSAYYHYRGIQFSNCVFGNINTKDTTARNWIDSQPGSTTAVVGFVLDGCSFYGKSGTTRTTDSGLNIRGAHSGCRFRNVHIKDIGGIAFRFNDNSSITPTLRDCILEGCIAENATDVGFQVVSKTATGTGTLTEIHFLGCIAKDTNSVTSGSGFQLNISQAGATISNIYFRNCRAYKTAGSTMNWGLSLVRSAGTVSGIWVSGCDWSGTVNGNMYFDAGATNVHYTPPTGLGTNIASAATIAIPQNGDVFHVTGSTNITNGITVNPWDNGRTVTLIFEGTPTVSDTGTSKLAGNFVAAGTTNDFDALTICCNGTNWIEVARSAN